MFPVTFTVLTLILVLVTISIYKIYFDDSSMDSEEVHETYGKIDKYTFKSYDCKTADSAQECVDELYFIQDRVNSANGPEKLKTYLAEQIKEAESSVFDLKYEKWESKAWDILQKFSDEFFSVVNADPDDFRYVEDVLKSRKRCINLWYKYFSLLDDLDIQVHPKDYMKQHIIGFEPCMLDSQELKKRLDEAVEKIKPEHKRKMKIYDDILSYVGSHDSIMRCDLLKHRFESASGKEVACCYRDLVNKYKLVEVKIGSRYFVTLSDKVAEKKKAVQSNWKSDSEKKERATRTKKSAKNQIEKTSYTKQEIKNISADMSIVCADNTPSGGRFWVESCPVADQFMREIKIDGKNPRYAVSTKSLGGKPGWYV